MRDLTVLILTLVVNEDVMSTLKLLDDEDREEVKKTSFGDFLELRMRLISQRQAVVVCQKSNPQRG